MLMATVSSRVKRREVWAFFVRGRSEAYVELEAG
jgi:hypothetical protein